jgi:anti-sigma factor ChrR (cupin superfamily)
MKQQLHTDVSQRVVLNTHGLPWQPSPVSGVERRPLERDGGEIARATSVVRYAAGARFTSHTHELGEEFLVLEGIFEDEHGSYGPGTYVKNPPGSLHTPFTRDGVTIWVKLRHLDVADTERVVVDTSTAQWYPGMVAGLSVLPLAEFATQHTALVRWAPGTRFNRHRHFGGEEIFVVHGTFEDEHGSYPAGTWIRSPHMSEHQPFSLEGCTILVKTGHLPL